MTDAIAWSKPLRALELSLRNGLWVRLLVFSVFGLVLHWHAFEHAGELNMFRDAQFLSAYEANAARILGRFGQLPLWDPYSCGGMYLLGNPQPHAFTPLVWLSLWLGAGRALPLLAWTLFVSGCEGSYRWLFGRAGNALGATLGAMLFCASGYIAFSFSLGWIQFYSFLMIPWLLHGIRRVLEGRAVGLLLVAGTFAFILGFGGTYPAPLAVLMAVAEVLRSLQWRRHRAAQLRVLVLLALAIVVLALYRIWPILEEFSRAPRIMAGRPSHSIVEVGKMVGLPRVSQQGSAGLLFVGAAFALVAPFGLLRRRGWSALALLGLCVLLALGYHADGLGAFPLLRRLPLYDSLRYPERMLLLGTLYLGELVAHAFAWFASLRVGWRWLLTSLGLATAVFGLHAEGQSFAGTVASITYGEPPAEEVREFQQARGNRWLMAYFGPMSRGSLACGEAYPVSMSPLLRGDLAHDEYLQNAEDGTVRRVTWTPERIDLQVDVQRDARVLINQNWHPGWRSSEGRVVAHEGLLAVDVPAGSHHLSVSFRPRSGIAGMIASSLGVLVLLVIAVDRRNLLLRHRSWPLFVALVMPLGVAAAALPWLPNPMAKSETRNAAAEPLLVAELPEGATPLDVELALPVRFAGVQIARDKDEYGILAANLFVSVHGPVARDVGIFLHARREGGGFVNLDREVVGGSYFLKNAPNGVLMADSFGLDTTTMKAGRWTLYGGLWDAAAKQRIEVARGESTADGVPLATFEIVK